MRLFNVTKKVAVISGALSLSLFVLTGSMYLRSANAEPVVEGSVYLLPTEVSGSGWQNISTIGTQDVSGDALFSSFNVKNSSFIIFKNGAYKEEEVLPSVEELNVVTEVVTENNEEEGGGKSVEVNEIEDESIPYATSTEVMGEVETLVSTSTSDTVVEVSGEEYVDQENTTSSTTQNIDINNLLSEEVLEEAEETINTSTVSDFEQIESGETSLPSEEESGVEESAPAPVTRFFDAVKRVLFSLIPDAVFADEISTTTQTSTLEVLSDLSVFGESSSTASVVTEVTQIFNEIKVPERVIPPVERVAVDSVPPVVTVLGNNPAVIPLGATYNDLGASVTDNVNNNLGVKVFLDNEEVKRSVSIDTTTPGKYRIMYQATDQAGNVGNAVRMVYVGIEPDNTDEVLEMVVSDAQETFTCIEGDMCTSNVLEVGGFGVGADAFSGAIETAQLRISAGGKVYYRDEETKPLKLNIQYFYEDSWIDAGSIILDEEVSNALNGGYFLYALPIFESWDALSDFRVRVRYDHPKTLEGEVYIDSIWVEIFSGEGSGGEDGRVTKEEAKKIEIAKRVKSPKLNSVIKGKSFFEVSESPEFEFEYTLQRSKLSRFVRGLFTDGPKYRVGLIEVKTASGQGVHMPISVRYGGDERWRLLIEKNQASMHPGKYEVSVTIHEGSKTFTDSFEFYWGVLTVNTNKSIYVEGETVQFSMAALTDNGHTMCDADLRLTVLDPEGSEVSVPVQQSGLCDGNNVVDVPDYFGEMSVGGVGEYSVLLERYDELGSLVIQTHDIFQVKEFVSFDVERTGPTRIYPPAPYTMKLSFTAYESFSGIVTETLPKGFVVEESDGGIVSITENAVEISWPVSVRAGEYVEKSYQFDAPDISPYIFELGPLVFKKQGVSIVMQDTPDCIEENCVQFGEDEIVFEEIRTWKIASDAVGRMLILWDGGAAPSGWECVSCTGGDPFYQRFIRGEATYGATGGSATHTHTVSTAIGGPSASTGQTPGGTTVSGSGHTHTLTPTIGTGSNLPEYRQLRVLRSTSAGTPATLPAGAIVFFTDTVPAGWTRYSAQDGRFVRGENTVTTTGGSNTHTHAISGTTGAASGDTYGTQSGQTRADVAQANHTHTVSGTTNAGTNVPPYIETILGKINAEGSLPIGMLAMWDEDVPVGWNHMSESGDPFYQRFILPSATYGTTGGTSTHSHANQDIVSSVPAQVTTARAVGNVSSADHTHIVSLTNYSSQNHLPPYINVVIAEFLGTDPVFSQALFRWYTNTNAETPTDAWPSGGTLNIIENEPITSTSTPLKPNDVVRLRMSVGVSNATSTAGSVDFKLQYGQGSSCGAVATWSDVGEISSSTPWRGYNNASVLDGATLSSTTLSLSTVFGSYEEENNSTTTPNEAGVGEYIEFDWVLQHNNATSGVEYCFRMVEGDGTPFLTYSTYPKLQTNSAPETSTLTRLFDNEKVASTTPHFWFVSTDDENNTLYYQIQIDEAPDFASTVVDKNSQAHGSLFTNLVSPTQKEPYTQGNTVRFIPDVSLTNNTTYWWRVRAWDPTGSTNYSEWSNPQSFTVDVTVVESTWFQTTEEQFDTNTLSGVYTPGIDAVELNVGSTTGAMYSSLIEFSSGTYGNIWEEFSFNDVETTGSISYQIEYQTATGTALIPNSVLPGNSTGFGTSPVSLAGVDPELYDTLRIVANFTNSGGSPRLLDWTLTWGTKIDAPTHLLPFANERFPTTTPTFTFVTTDPQSDDLQYEISWSTDNTFTSSTTRNSLNHSGFRNSENAGDTNPFNSGDVVAFTIQPADALTASTTYWWRARAKDPNGGNSFSDWSEPKSFTHNYNDIVSTWFQTTDEQFSTNVLSGTRITGSDALTVATTSIEAMIAYGEAAVTTPRYRIWDGASWSTEGSALTVGAQINWVVLKEAPTREEYILGTLGTDSDVNVQIYSEGVWGNLFEVTPSISNANKRGFDIAYESLSGDAMVVTCDGDSNPTFYVWNGSSWSSPGTITTATGSSCEWIRLASNPVSDEIIMVTLPGGGAQYEAQVWNGSVWGNAVTWGGMSEANEGIGVAYQPNGALAVVTVNNDGASPPSRMSSRTWNGSFWSGTTNTNVGYFEQGSLVGDDGTNNMNLCFVNDATTIQTIPWNGTAWGTQVQLDAVAHGKDDRPVDCVYEVTSGRDGNVMVAYSDATAARFSVFSGTWSTEASISTIGRSATIQLERTGNGLILGTFFDHVNGQYDFSYWNGSAWSTAQTLEASPSVSSAPFKEPFMMAARGPATSGVVAVSPGIVFTEGTGPYWGEITFNHTTPGSSNIVYQVQYATGTTYALIPDGALTGNSTGFTSGPIDLTGLDIETYGTLRLRATLTCDGANCPTLNDWTLTWAEGATISGTIAEYDEATNVTSGTVSVAVNGVLQTGKTGTIQGDGTWSIANVTLFENDVVTVFVSGATDENKAVGVTKYDGSGDVTGMQLFERHVTIGSNDAPLITNADLGLFDREVAGNDLFHTVDASNNFFATSTGAGFNDVVLFIGTGATYQPDSASSGDVATHDIVVEGTFVGNGNTISLSGSWVNSGTFTAGTSHVIFTATTGAESLDGTGASVNDFYRVTFGQTTGSATWALETPLVVTNNTAIDYGTLSPGTQPLLLGGNLALGVNGIFTKGSATTTFNGTGSSSWTDLSASKQDLGIVVVDGTSKTVTLGSNVRATNIIIGSNDTFDVTTGNYTVFVEGSWTNNNVFLSRQGGVNFSGSVTNTPIQSGSSSFYNLSFSGTGSWLFTPTTVTVTNDFSVSNGAVTLPSGTTTVNGSFSVTGSGSFISNTGTVAFAGTGSGKTISQNGSDFYNLSFTGSGAWSFTETHATTTNNVRVTAGSVSAPSGVFAIGGSFTNSSTFTHNSGTLRFFSSSQGRSVNPGSSSINNIIFDGVGGGWSLPPASNVTVLGDFTIISGIATGTAGTLSVGGSWYVDSLLGTFNHSNGTVLFNSSDTGEIVESGDSPFSTITFSSSGGGWTVAENATATVAWNLTNAASFTVQSGVTIDILGIFSHSIASSSTTWTGSTLKLNSGGSVSLNTKTSSGDTYGTLLVGSGTRASMWNSDAVAVITNTNSSLYSQDHASVNGSLAIFGDYVRTSGTEHWSYATDFDGTSLTGGNERSVTVAFAPNATGTISNATLSVVGEESATTTITNQGSGTYGLRVINGTTTAEYYAVRNTNTDGFVITGNSVVTSLSDGDFELGVDGGSMLTVSSSTIGINPVLQVFRTRFATSTGVTSGFNVTATGTPTSYWWFREHYGNYDGEAHDSDPGGNPGDIWWDDSNLTITISGIVYEEDRITPLGGPTCNGSTEIVTVYVPNSGTFTASCNSGTGAFSIPDVSFNGDVLMTVYLDTNGGAKAVTVLKTPSANVTDLALYQNWLTVRNEDVGPVTILDLTTFDSNNDGDIFYTAEDSSPDTLTLSPEFGVYIPSGKTFAPGGNITLSSGGVGSIDGTLELGPSARLTLANGQSHAIGGSFIVGTNATATIASSTLAFTATTSGKIITPNGSSLYNVSFLGSGGGWILGTSTITGDFVLDAGVVSGVSNVAVTSGDITGDGELAFTDGIFTLSGAGQFGGSQPWLFAGLTLGNGATVATTTKYGNNTISARTLTVGANHVLDAGDDTWTLSGSGAPLVTTGTLNASTSSFIYTGTSATAISAEDYYNVSFAPQSGSPTYTTASGNISAYNITVGNGTDAVSVNANTNDPIISVANNFTISDGATFIASNSSDLVIAGSYENNGTFTHSSGTVRFNASNTGENISAGASSFGTVVLNNSLGGWTVTENATTTGAFILASSSSFTLADGVTLTVGGVFENSVLGSGTTWSGSVLRLNGGGSFSINSATSSGDTYGILEVTNGTDIRMWSSSAGTTTVASTASLYSQDHSGVDGSLYIWGDYARTTGTDYWSYATDFDGTSLTGGNERQVNVRFAPNATTTLSGGSLQIVGTSTATTTIDRQSTGTYALRITGGTLNANRYQIRNIDSSGLTLSGTPTVTSLSNGDYELSNEGGTMISVSSTTIDFNPTLTISAVRFATSTGITSGFNVTRIGTPINAWTFAGHSGNFDGESYDDDGGDACGYIRWSDSVCLFVSQDAYRFRNDNGGEGVPVDEWFDADWGKRVGVHISNASTSALTNQQILIELPKAASMQSDYGDLRFTDSSGTTTIDYWIERYTTSTSTVWVEVPYIPAEESTYIYAYYDTVATLTTTGVATSTFVVYDGFEDNNISEYSGDTSMFAVSATFDFEGNYGLTSSPGNEDQRTTDGIYRTGAGSTISQGQTIQFAQYIDTSLGFQDEPCMLFGVQTPGSNNQNYAACLDVFGDSVVIAKDVSSNDSSGTTLASDTSVGFSSGWYTVEIDWLTSGIIAVRVYDDSGALFSEVSTNDASYSSGGYGFGYWLQYGGWDYVSAQYYIAIPLTYSFGLEQVGGGATWSSAENTPLTGQTTDEDIRLRFLVKNSGPGITDQNFRLQIAPKTGYGSCASVPYNLYEDVPVSGSCGNSAACMSTSSEVVDGALTSQLLSVPENSSFIQGNFVESPSNQTSAIDIDTNEYTEIEYIFGLTNYAIDSAYCFRTTDSGVPLDNYAHVAEISLIFPPTITNFNLNNTQAIELLNGTTTTVYATGTAIDLNGFSDFLFATSTIYRTGVGPSCTPNDNSCYQIASTSCSFTNCSGNSCEVICGADIAFFADPTDGGAFIGEEWEAQITIVDQSGYRDTGVTMGVELGTLRALAVENEIDYGELEVASDTGATNATSTVINKGNDYIDVDVYGTDLVGNASTITVDNQKFATSTFSYTACAFCPFLDSNPVPVGVNLIKPTSYTPIETDIYWGIQVPLGTAGVPHYGQTTFEAAGI